MKVSQLIEELQKLPQDYEVVVSSDEEGNNFSALTDIGYGVWNPAMYEFSSWIEPEEEDEDGYIVYGREREATLEESNAVVLWP